MYDERRRRRGRRQRTWLALVASITCIAATLVGGGAASASGKLAVEGSVVFDDGSPAADVQVAVYEAVDPWTRGHYLGSVTTDSHGRYGFSGGDGCFIVVVIAPLGAEFDVAGSGDVYDQLYGCSPAAFRSVLARDTSPPPPTTQPPTTQPPTTQPPTTQPPTTQPPTTQPPVHPPDPPTRCLYRPGARGHTSFLASSAETYETGTGRVFHLSEITSRFGDAYTANFVIGRLRAVGADGQKSAWAQCQMGSPIGLDVDGSGAVERISGEFSFDVTGDGEVEALGEWFAPTEGILFDTRVAGDMSGAHLFGDEGGRFADGFEKLALLDADADGLVAGAELDGLAVWTDGNSNAAAEPGEISSLADHQIVALSTNHVDMVSEAILADGSTMMTEDLWFPAAVAGAGNVMTRVGIGSVAMVGLLMAAFRGSARRREQLDAELRELVDTTVHH